MVDDPLTTVHCGSIGEGSGMNSLEINRLENCLRGMLTGMIVIRKSGRGSNLAEFEVGGRALGTVHRETAEDGGIGFHVHFVILEEDLHREPSRVAGVPVKGSARRR